jgi:hypothetical protein
MNPGTGEQRHITALLSVTLSYISFFFWINAAFGIALAVMGIILGTIGRHAYFQPYLYLGGRVGIVGVKLGVIAIGLHVFFFYLSN